MSDELEKCGEQAMNGKRKAYQNLPVSENPQFYEDANRIYKELRTKYPNNTDNDLDNILNGICLALMFVMKNHVGKDDHKNFLQLIYHIINRNLDKI